MEELGDYTELWIHMAQGADLSWYSLRCDCLLVRTDLPRTHQLLENGSLTGLTHHCADLLASLAILFGGLCLCFSTALRGAHWRIKARLGFGGESPLLFARYERTSG